MVNIEERKSDNTPTPNPTPTPKKREFKQKIMEYLQLRTNRLHCLLSVYLDI
jgi:hypothetical protein